jgi:hypothetical protein
VEAPGECGDRIRCRMESKAPRGPKGWNMVLVVISSYLMGERGAAWQGRANKG